MGIKGRRRKQRLRAETHDGGIDADAIEDPELRELALAGELPEGLIPAGQVRMKKSQLYAMQDDDVLEAMQEEHRNRKASKPQKKHRAEAAEDEQLAPTADAGGAFNDDAAVDEATMQTSRAKTVSGAPFTHAMLELDERVTDALAMAGFTRMTRIQSRAIPLALQGYDLLGQAKTGSGKTLAFGIPILNSALMTVATNPSAFVALVLSPTKELSAQIAKVFNEVTKFLKGPKGGQMLTCELITGGTKLAEERRRLLACNIAVGTPGRVLDHVNNTSSWTIRTTLTHFVMDEADRLLADGFQRDLDAILQVLPVARQTLLFSATNSKSVRELARLSLSKSPIFVASKGDAPQALDGSGVAPPYVDFDDVADADVPAEAGKDTKHDEEAIPSSLKQFCQVVPQHEKLLALYAFVKRVARRRKAMVFCSTVASAQFHCMMMGAAGFHDAVLMLHGKMKHRQRLATFDTFLKWDTGVLFCTDVAARGLDIPRVDWILQYDPPTDPTEYIHRIGRTARAGAVGSALLFVTPQEQPFVPYLAKYGIRMDVLPSEDVPDLHMSMQRILQVDPIVAKHAVAAFRAHVAAYQSHILTSVFDVRALNLEDVAISFALETVPSVSLPKSTQEEKKQDYVKGKLKSLRKRTHEARAEYERLKTKQQWADDGTFVGMKRPDPVL